MTRDSPVELDLLFTGPTRSRSVTRCPARAQDSAVHAPKTPAPTITMSIPDAVPMLVHQAWKADLSGCDEGAGFSRKPFTVQQSKIANLRAGPCGNGRV